MRDFTRPAAARRVQLHFQQIDQRAAAREDSVALQQRLMLERLEIQVLRKRVDKILVGN